MLARGDLFPDALAASALTGLHDSPLLLTEPDRLPNAVRDWLARHAPLHVIVVGGPAAIGDEVAEELARYDSDGRVERIGGADRYRTAAMIARRVGPGPRALIASGHDAADASVAGPAAHALTIPLLLTSAGPPPEATRDALRDLGIEQLLVVGGPAAVSDDTVAQLAESCRPDPCRIVRIAGPDRTATSLIFADWLLDQTRL